MKLLVAISINYSMMLFESRYSELDYSQRKIKLYQKKIEELGGNK